MRRGALSSWRRRAVAALCLAALIALLAPPLAGAASDVWGNVGPSPQLGGEGIAGRYPLVNYSLDQHFDAVSASLTGGVDVSGVAPMIAYFLASILWLATSFLANLLIALFTFAFSLDLVTGSEATGGAGALAPVSRAIHSIYAGVLGRPWLVLAVAVAGIWAMWKALVQRRYSETAGALGLSLIYVVLALFFVAQPGATIGSVSGWTNQMSGAFLSISSHGDASSSRQAKEQTANRLFDLLVFKPWVVLDFGGLEHCVRSGTGSADSDPESVAVRPLSSNASRDVALGRSLRSGTQVTADGKVCVNNAAKYAPRFLRHGVATDERDREYEALNDGDASGLPDAERAGYRLGVADKPATDAMEEGGQYQRLLLALVLFVGELGAFCLLGALSIGVILAQVLMLLLLAFSPVALIAAVIPGRGHAFFKGWLEKLAGFLLRKAAYSLVLAVLLAVAGALASATDELGWLMSFGLQSLFFWAVFLQRKSLADSLIGIATGPRAPGRDASLRLLALYGGARATSGPLRGIGRGARSATSAPRRLFGGGRDSGGGQWRAPRFGASVSAPAGDAPRSDGPAPAERPRRATPTAEEIGKAASGTPAGASSSQRPDAGAATAKAAGGREKRPPGDSATGGPRLDDGQTGRSARREGRHPAAQSPDREPTAPDQGEDSLGGELRAERERGRGAAKEPPADKRADPGRDTRPPRKRRKGGGR